MRIRRARPTVPKQRPAFRETSGVTPRDLADEALAGLFARPARMILTVMGTVIGIAALVATLGLSRTAGNQIIGRFDALSATEIVASAKPGAAGADAAFLPWDAPARMTRLNGVVAAGNLSAVNIGSALIRTSPVSDPGAQTAFELPVVAASPGLFASVHAQLRTGRFLDQGNSDRADRVALLGPAAALRLGIVSVNRLPAIAIGDRLYLVVGILSDVARQPDMLGAVIIPEGTARRDFALTSPGIVAIETQIGAAALISRQTPLALRPDNPAALKIASPPEPQRVRDAVQNDLDKLFLLLGAVSLLVGAIGIANVTLVSVIERTGEIGLRRALGATRLHIAEQFLMESTAMGLVGGILGASLGTLLVVFVSAAQTWTPVLDPLLVVAAPLIGATIGLLAGTYPAIRAARMEPVEALRSGT